MIGSIFSRLLSFAAVLTVFAGSGMAGTVMSISTITPTVSDTFRDTTNAYFGIVDQSGKIEGGSLNIFSTPPVGAVAGEDLNNNDDDSGIARPDTRIASWSLTLPADAEPGTGLTDINFSGLFAANSAAWDAGTGVTGDYADFHLVLNADVNNPAQTVALRPRGTTGSNLDLGFDTDMNGDGSDGAVVSATSGSGISLSHLGGATVSSVQVLLAVHADAGNEEFWANGTLSASYAVSAVPEPTAFSLVAIVTTGACASARLRKRNRLAHSAV